MKPTRPETAMPADAGARRAIRPVICYPVETSDSNVSSHLESKFVRCVHCANRRQIVDTYNRSGWVCKCQQMLRGLIAAFRRQVGTGNKSRLG